MKNTVLLITLLVLLTGCASFHSHQVTKDGTITDVRIYSLWDSKSELTKLKATTTDKSQVLGIGVLSNESTSTNINTLVESIVSAAVKAAVKP